MDPLKATRLAPRLSAAVVLLLAVVLVAVAANDVQAGRHTITSLPYTFDAGDHTGDAVDTLVIQGTKLSASGSGISLNALYNNPLHGVLLDLGTDTISFGEGGGNNAIGVLLGGTGSYYPYDIEIRGGYILHNTPSSSSDGCRAVQMRGHHNTVRNVTATVRGHNGQVYSAEGSTVYECSIIGGHFTSYVTGFSSRCNYDACVVEAVNLYTSTLTDNGAECHFRVDGLTIANGPHVGVFVCGRETEGNYGVSDIANCNIQTDAINDFYTSYSGTCMSSSNPYGISVRHTGAGTKIRGNTITSGTARGGNRGILIEYGNGTVSNPIEVYDNNIDVHEGPNVEYGETLETHALRIRYSPKVIHVYDNTFICRGDANTSTDDYGSRLHTVRISVNETGSNVVMSRNTVRAIASSSSGMTACAMTFDDIEYDNSVRTEYNRILSSGAIYKFGDFNGGARGNVMVGDTVGFESVRVDPATYHVGHLGNDWDCQNNVSADIVYQNGAADDDIHLASNGTLEICLQRILNVAVEGDNGLPVPGTTVTVTNNYGQTVVSGTTGGSGIVSGSVTYFYQSRSTDSSNFNGFRAKALKGSDSVITTFNVTATSASPTLTLPNTAGAPDTIPPAPIMDLGATTGSANGEIDLAWTAPGEDGSTGTAAAYQIRYATGLITAGNWTSANVFGNPPTPGIAGSTQSVTLTGLTPGTTYYVGVKAVDASGNYASLSNVSSAAAYFSFVTGDDDPQVVLAAPATDSAVSSTQPVLVAVNIDDQSGNVYYFEVASDSSFGTLAAASPAVAQETGSTTAWKVSPRLDAGETYFWRARANDNPYSTIAWFSVEPVTHPYPNPFHPEAHHTVAFTEVTQGTNLVVMSVSGQLVRRWVNNSGDDILWDGTNAAGSLVASGTYLWFVEDSEVKGKLIVVR